MASIAALRHRWVALLPAASGASGLVLACFEDLARAYGAEGRHYHTLDHVAALLDLADAEARCFEDPGAVALAIFFHDAVYDARRPLGNEHASAEMASDQLRRLGLPPARYERVRRHVEATAHLAGSPLPTDPDCRRFLDLDLAVLAAPDHVYDGYAAAIRREYGHVPDQTYGKGRAAVLNAFLGRDRLYLCDDHHVAWTGRARANMQRELASLERPTP